MIVYVNPSSKLNQCSHNDVQHHRGCVCAGNVMSERLGPGLEMCSLDYNQPSIQQELPYGKDHGGPPVHGIIQGRKGSIPLDIIVAAMMRLQQISKHAKERRRRGQQRIRIIIGVMLKDGANLSLESCNGEIHPTKSNFR